MAVKLNLYLGRLNVERLELIKPDYRTAGVKELRRVFPLYDTPLPFDADAFVNEPFPTSPVWLGYVSQHFEVGDLRNRSVGLVLVFGTAGRQWCLTFGTGHHCVNLGAVEPGFGLRVCANSLDPEAVRTMANRRLGAITRQQITHISRGSRVADLGVVLDQDWVRYLAGRSATDDLPGTLSGSDALSLKATTPLADLPALCAHVLDRFGAMDYRSNFAFIDQLRPMRSAEPVVQEMNDEVERRILDRNPDNIHLAPPEIPDDAHLTGYRIWAARRHADIENLDVMELYDALDALPPVDEYLKSVNIAPLDDDGTVGRRDALARYLVAELKLPNGLFVHSLGSWFEIDTDYAGSITRQVSALDDVSDVLRLPAWKRTRAGTYDEAVYNAEVARETGWVLLDGKFVYHGGPNQKVEICDLLSDNDDHICVKRAESSATLSHLFNQAAVICDLYRSYDDEFLRKAADVVDDASPGRKFPDLRSPSFIYAIGTHKPGPLAESLFFFSKLALVAKATEIRGRGARVAVARIQMK